MSRFVRSLLLCAGLLIFVPPTLGKAAVLEKQTDGIVVPIIDACVALEVWADNTIRVAYSKDRSFFDRKSLAGQARQGSIPAWRASQIGNQITITTAKLTVRVNAGSGTETFLDRQPKSILGGWRRRGDGFCRHV